MAYSQEVYEEEQSHRQTGTVSKESSWEPEVALVTMNVQDRMNESVVSLDGPWTSRMPSCVMNVRKEGRMRGGESQIGQPKGSPALHDSSAGWPVTIVGHFDLAGCQTVICHFVFTVECIDTYATFSQSH